MARAALGGDEHVLRNLASGLIRVQRDNLVERPWGGDWIRRFKGIPEGEDNRRLPWGEAFEISAFSDDEEAGRYPSRIVFDDGSLADLPALLKAHGRSILGDAFVARYGSCFPLLPKTLDVKELLSVQGHPPGHTEVYIIVDAEPGATLRLGFGRDIDPAILSRELSRGIDAQRRLIQLLGPDADATSMQTIVGPWLAAREAELSLIRHELDTIVSPQAADAAASLLRELKQLYWHVLDSMNVIEVEPGQVIHNATPARLLQGEGCEPSAEVHALGNPERREILALEVRRPGPTFRAWDNVRFPRREVDVVAAIEALNLRRTGPGDFLAERRPVPGREGAFVSVESRYFRVEHLMPERSRRVSVPASIPHSLHCVAGAVEIVADDGRSLGSLERGESALVPIGTGAYHVESAEAADVVRLTLPES